MTPELWLLMAGIPAAGVAGWRLPALLRADGSPASGESWADPEVGIGGPLAFEKWLEDHANTQRVAVIAIDFDHVRSLNDLQGRQRTEELVRDAGRLFVAVQREAYGANAPAFRIGPDDFVLVLEGVGETEAVSLSEVVRHRMAKALDVRERILGLSCGVACCPAHASTPREAWGAAQRALFHAKRSGRNRTVTYARDQLEVDTRHTNREVIKAIARTLAAAVDAKDAYTHAHSQNVADLSQYLALAMGLEDHVADDIQLGGLLHDIGKIGVSDQVLKKPGRLTTEEWEEIKTHCEIGYQILAGLDGADHIREMVLYHHERPDGTGYPHGLTIHDIPLSAAIVGVADAFDSMTAERVYQQPRSAEDALQEIVNLRGKQFHPQVVDALCRLMVYDVGQLDPPDEGDASGGLAAAA